jgi:hypothetical protein
MTNQTEHERAERWRLKAIMAEEEAAEMRAKLGRLCPWALDMLDMLSKAVSPHLDTRGVWSSDENDTLHHELRRAAQQYSPAGHSNAARAAMEFVESLEWFEQCEDFWLDNEPQEDTAFWRCWQTIMEEAQDYHDQAYRLAIQWFR